MLNTGNVVMATIVGVCIMLAAVLLGAVPGCSGAYHSLGDTSRKDVASTRGIGDKLTANQPTPTDIDHSLERYNLIRRAYWVNGQREKAIQLPCPIAIKPLGHIVLFSFGKPVGKFIVDGKVTSLQSFLTPDSEYYELVASISDPDNLGMKKENYWLPDVDGSYGDNDRGIFFFTPDGKYIEWTGEYLYSDIPFNVADTLVSYEAQK